MGGRGASSSGGTGGGATGGITGANVVTTDSLISARGQYQNEVDQTLTVLRDVEKNYGVVVEDAQIATLQGKGARSVMAYYDNKGNLAINKNYFDAQKMDQAYDACVDAGFHPSRGNKTGLEAVTAHELGHRLTDVIGEKMGYGSWAIDKVADDIVTRAAKRSGHKSIESFRSKISGYGSGDNAEAIAEAFADVYCNGSKAGKESKAVVRMMNNYFGR